MAKEKATRFVVRFRARDLKIAQGGPVTINGVVYRISMILAVRPYGKKIVEVTLLARAIEGLVEN